MKKNGLAKNVLFGFTSWLLPLGMTFFATPLIVHKLGAEEYGIYALITGFISYSFSFNIGRAVTKYVSEYKARNEDQKIAEVISTTLLLNLFIGTVGAAVFTALARWFTVDLLQIEPHLQEKTVTAFYLAAACVWLTMLGQVFSAILQALQRFDFYSHITTLVNFLIVAGNLILALSGFGVNTILAWNVVMTGVNCLLFYVTARKLLPEMRFSWKSDKKTFRTIAKYSVGVTAYQIFANLLLLFERSWITRTLGTESLTFYTVPMTFAVYLHAFTNSLTLVFFPLTSELYAQNQTDTLKNLYLRATKIICALVVFIALTLAVGSRELLYNWVGTDFAEKSAQVMILQLVVFGLLAILVTSWQMTEGIGMPAYNAGLTFFWLAVTSALMIWWTENHDLTGAAWARLCGVAIVPFSILYIEKKVFGQVQLKFWLKTIFCLSLAGLAAATAEYLVLKNLPVNWLTLLFGFGVSSIIFISGLWITEFADASEKRWLGGFIKKAIA